MLDVILAGVTKKYKDQVVVDDISLKIGNGELLALVGHSGCGKTTMLRLIAGLSQPDKGKILIGGQESARLKARKREIVMVFQENLLFPHLNVADNIAFGLKMGGVSKKERVKRAQEMLNLVRLPGLAGRYPSQLSGGQQQRVSLARALALEPKILLLDEPLSNLDPKLRDELRDLILLLHRRFKMTTVLVTHDRDEAMMMADRIAVMYYGSLLQVGKPVDIYCRPVSSEVANLFGQCNYITGFLKGSEFQTEDYRFTVPVLKKGGRVEACVRTEHIKIIRPISDRPSGVVIEKKFSGGYSLLKVSLGGMNLIAKDDNLFDLHVGDRVGLDIDWPQVHFNQV